ncbi:MAG: 2-hydroxyhepta-2,4-diene-1,7-dioate isomerase [Flavobacteriaceae bacterium]|nr:2-hydroxyhepta-2,4-diene-1,7-dioate isomerase [Flavobacteriaceae bacterium]
MKIICVGRNYAAHIEELQSMKPKEPILFLKPETSIIHKSQPFFIPHFSSNIDYEVEVLIRINRIGKHIQPKFAYKYYQEISLGIDFTARTLQNKLKENGLPWEKAKAFDGSALIGEWISKSEYKDLNDLNFSLELNGTEVQKGNTSNMLWKINDLISYISTYFTLKIGDIIFTGTPQGVGSIKENDVILGYLEGKQAFSIKIK